MSGIEHLDFDCEYKFGAGEPDGAVEGYAAIFNIKDNGGDVIMPGAFSETIAARNGAPLPMLWNHSADNLIGNWTAAVEDRRGLKVSGRINMGAPAGANLYPYLKDGTIRGLSIGFFTIDANRDAKTGVRVLQKAELVEASFVLNGMHPKALLTAIKGMTRADGLGERAVEEALRDAGLSHREAKAGVAKLRERGAFRDGTKREPALRDAVADVLKSIRLAAGAMSNP